MALNKICKFFVFLTSFFVFFFGRGPHGTVVFSGRPYKKPFQHTVEKEKNQDKKNGVPSRVAFVRNFAPRPSQRYAVFLTTEKNESARYGGRASVRTDTIANLRKSTYLR